MNRTVARTIPRVTFLVTRVCLAGRGSQNGPDAQDREEVLFEDRPLGLWETVAELQSCDSLSCSHRVKPEELKGDEQAETDPVAAGRGWTEQEIVIVKRSDGKPVDGRMLHWLFRMAELAW